MPVDDRMIIGFHDMMRRRMDGGQHVAEFVVTRQTVQRWSAPDIIRIAEKWYLSSAQRAGSLPDCARSM